MDQASPAPPPAAGHGDRAKPPARNLLSELGEVWGRIPRGWGRTFKWGAASALLLALVLPAAAWLFSGGQAAGAIGDAAGLANAVVSGMAFAVLVATILLQSRELELQREELSAQKAEMVGQRAALEETARAQAATSKVLGEQLGVAQRDARLRALGALVEVYDRMTGQAQARVTALGASHGSSGEQAKHWAKRLSDYREELLELLWGETKVVVGEDLPKPPKYQRTGARGEP